ncbi:MAG: T9SS type A sorting domain-containing protein, partial [Calditrichia bacterium]|nr:T9SS type A sorting domain-containing protein [Calditrichia bacterium]
TIPVTFSVAGLGIDFSGLVGLSDMPADLSGSQVELVKGEDSWIDSTDAFGQYSFVNMFPGTYDLHFSHTGYGQFDTTIVVTESVNMNVMLIMPASPPFNLSANQPGFGQEVGLTWDKPITTFPKANVIRSQTREWKYKLLEKSKDVTGYNVYRSADGGTTFELLNQAGPQVDTFYVDANVEYDNIYHYYVTAVYDPEGESNPSNTVNLPLYDGPQAILLVDDDGSNGGTYTDISTYYMNALNELEVTYTYHEVPYGADGPDLSTLRSHDAVIWFTGETWNSGFCPTLTENDESGLATYLDIDGRLILIAQDYIRDAHSTAGEFSEGQFPYDYLGVNSTFQDSWGSDSLNVTGVTESFTEGMSFKVESVFRPNSLFPDFLVTEEGQYLFNHLEPEGHSSICYDGGDFKTVFSTTEIAGMVEGESPNTIADYLYKALKFLGHTVVGIEDELALPTVFKLEQNYPNPFNPTTTINYQLPKTVNVKLEIFNIMGQKIRTLINEKIEAGYQNVLWNGTNDHGVQVSSGMYFYKITAGDYSKSHKMILIK